MIPEDGSDLKIKPFQSLQPLIETIETTQQQISEALKKIPASQRTPLLEPSATPLLSSMRERLEAHSNHLEKIKKEIATALVLAAQQQEANLDEAIIDAPSDNQDSLTKKATTAIQDANATLQHLRAKSALLPPNIPRLTIALTLLGLTLSLLGSGVIWSIGASTAESSWMFATLMISLMIAGPTLGYAAGSTLDKTLFERRKENFWEALEEADLRAKPTASQTLMSAQSDAATLPVAYPSPTGGRVSRKSSTDEGSANIELHPLGKPGNSNLSP